MIVVVVVVVFVFDVPPTAKVIWPRLKVSPARLVKPEIEPATPGLQGKRFIHYTTTAPSNVRILDLCRVAMQGKMPI